MLFLFVLQFHDRSNPAPLKKKERHDFEIHFAKCKQHEAKQVSWKNKFFPAKVPFLELSNYN